MLGHMSSQNSHSMSGDSGRVDLVDIQVNLVMVNDIMAECPGLHVSYRLGQTDA